MNNVDVLTKLLTVTPEDDITAYLLTDALMEEHDRTRSEANRIVCNVRLAAYDARDLAQAAELIRADSPDRSAVVSLIYKSCEMRPAEGANIILVPGMAAPKANCQYKSSLSAWWYDWTVSVGAAWLITTYTLYRDKEQRRRGGATVRHATSMKRVSRRAIK